MFGLGKPRSKFGEFLDMHGITTEEFAKESKVSSKTIGKARNDKKYMPGQSVTKKIMLTVKKVDNSKKMSDFWDI